MPQQAEPAGCYRSKYESARVRWHAKTLSFQLMAQGNLAGIMRQWPGLQAAAKAGDMQSHKTRLGGKMGKGQGKGAFEPTWPFDFMVRAHARSSAFSAL